MPIVGKLLKKTNEVAYLRSQKRCLNKSHQIDQLLHLLQTAKKTKFGVQHKFMDILSSDERIKKYQENVPITDYDGFFEAWIKDSMLGAKDHTWPGRINHYALSSGTTGSPSKRIPVTNQMLKSFQKSSLMQLAMLHELDLSDRFYSGQLLAVGGSSKLTKKEKYSEGDLSGILKKYTTFLVSPITKPNKKITEESQWKVKLEMMVQKAPEWNISILCGVPSWCILLMEKIVDHYNLKTIHDIWPNLEVYVHGGVFIQPYIPRLERILGKKVYLLDTYLASEGYFGYQKPNSNGGMELLVDAGVFFEFIPFSADYFDVDGCLKDNHLAYTLEEVVSGIDYAIVVSTNAGLWRYLIGDLVRFNDQEPRELTITGRIKQYLSLCGEHLSLDNINQALQSVSSKMSIEITEFTLYANEDDLSHHWFLGLDQAVDSQELISKIDKELFRLNDDYRCARSINLKDPVITILPVEQFYQFLESQGKLGAQHKFPRVLTKEQSQDWLYFIEGIEPGSNQLRHVRPVLK